jgi:hypothetical protein
VRVTSASIQEVILKLKELDSTHRTWKEKLEVVWEVVNLYKGDKQFASHGLALVAAYLYFINSH